MNHASLLEGDAVADNNQSQLAGSPKYQRNLAYGRRCCASSTSKNLVTEPRSWSCRYHRSWCASRLRAWAAEKRFRCTRPADLSTNSSSRVGSILVEVLRQKTSASRRSTRGWRADPEAQSSRASSEDGRAEHEVHDNVVDEDRGVDAPCPHGSYNTGWD